MLALLREAALLPARSLRLGLDTYTDPALLAERLGGLRESEVISTEAAHGTKATPLG